MPLSRFESRSFSHDGLTRTVYRLGEGPGVLVMPELPGITPAVARFAERVAAAGFTVDLVNLFGAAGHPATALTIAREVTRACVRREFAMLAAQRSSPITGYLRGLCRALHAELGGRGVGAIGMCITGNFALALMVDPWVMAPVLSQPSLPLPLGRERSRGLHLSDEDLVAVRARTAAGARVLGLRFTTDPVVPPARFERLRAELGAAFEGIEIDSSRGNPHGIHPLRAHSVLTRDLVDAEGHPTRAALDRVLSFLREELVGGGARA